MTILQVTVFINKPSYKPETVANEPALQKVITDTLLVLPVNYSLSLSLSLTLYLKFMPISSAANSVELSSIFTNLRFSQNGLLYYCISFFAVNREMKGTECRINLIKSTNVLYEHQDTSTGREIYRLLISLVELQKNCLFRGIW